MQPISAEAIFRALLTLGIFITISVTVEKITLAMLPRKLKFNLGPWPTLIILLLAVAIIIFALVRLDSVARVPGETEASDVNLVRLGAFLLLIGVIIYAGASLIYRKLGAYGIAVVLAGIFGFGIGTNLLLRQITEPEALTDDDLMFISVAVALVIVGVLAYIYNWMIQEQPAIKEQKIEFEKDSLIFRERRRKRLSKKR